MSMTCMSSRISATSLSTSFLCMISCISSPPFYKHGVPRSYNKPLRTRTARQNRHVAVPGIVFYTPSGGAPNTWLPPPAHRRGPSMDRQELLRQLMITVLSGCLSCCRELPRANGGDPLHTLNAGPMRSGCLRLPETRPSFTEVLDPVPLPGPDLRTSHPSPVRQSPPPSCQAPCRLCR